MKNAFWLILSLIVLAFRLYPDNNLHLIFCDVGQGDAILIKHRTSQVLIDGGPNETQVLACLRHNLPFWDREIEAVVLTHPENDHFKGLLGVFSHYRVKQFLANGLINEQTDFWQLQKMVVEQKINTHLPQQNETLRVGKIYFDIVWPEVFQGNPLVWQKPEKELKETTVVLGAEDPNSVSVVLRLRFAGFDALLTGDIPAEIERTLVWRKMISQPVEILKLAHHGSKSSTTRELLQTLRPKLAVISVGKNKFGHPSQEVLEELNNLGIKKITTQESGEIEIISDGAKWWLK